MIKVISKIGCVSFIRKLCIKKEFIIFFGKESITAVLFYNSQLIYNDNFDYTKKEIDQCCEMIKRHKNYKVTILVDSVECKLVKGVITVFDSFNVKSLTEKHLIEKDSNENIIAFKLYKKDQNKLHTTTAFVPFADQVERLITSLFHEHTHTIKVYLLSLELGYIMNYVSIFVSQDLNKYELEIFVAITKASGIRIAFKFRNKIVKITYCNPQDNNSTLYIQGVIEQKISEYLNQYHNIIKPKIHLMLLSPRHQNDIMFAYTKISDDLYVTKVNKFFTQDNDESEVYSDIQLLRIFSKTKKHLSVNKKIQFFNTVIFLKSFASKMLITMILILSIMSSKQIYHIIHKKRELQVINHDYHFITESYNKIAGRYQDIDKLLHLSNFYKTLSIFYNNKLNPIADLKTLLNILDKRHFFIKNIIWEVISPLAQNDQKHRYQMNIEGIFNNRDPSRVKAIDIIAQYKNKLSESLPQCDVSINYDIDQITNDQKQIIELSFKVIIPILIHIDNCKEQ